MHAYTQCFNHQLNIQVVSWLGIVPLLVQEGCNPLLYALSLHSFDHMLENNHPHLLQVTNDLDLSLYQEALPCHFLGRVHLSSYF